VLSQDRPDLTGELKAIADDRVGGGRSNERRLLEPCEDGEPRVDPIALP
jgi:hypothetical protein